MTSRSRSTIERPGSSRSGHRVDEIVEALGVADVFKRAREDEGWEIVDAKGFLHVRRLDGFDEVPVCYEELAVTTERPEVLGGAEFAERIVAASADHPYLLGYLDLDHNGPGQHLIKADLHLSKDDFDHYYASRH